MVEGEKEADDTTSTYINRFLLFRLFFFFSLPYLSVFSVYFLKFLNRIEMSASNLGHPSVEEVPPPGEKM